MKIINPETNSILYFFLLAELIWISLLDIKTQKIKNYWSILNIAVFFFLIVFASETYPLKIAMFYYSFGFLFVGFLLFLIKIMGAGDIKYLFSFFLILPLGIHQDMFNRLIVFTGICAFVFLTFNLVKNYKILFSALKEKKYGLIKNCFGTKFAFSPVILITWIWFGVDSGKFGF
ncbi:MAG: prepilin peptidase [Bacteriovoracaceae bacterium]|nr:prepilin peptidase [Bacteriovoracaceae bacterium]